ncbi:16S rRNA m(5)C-967 methyltransferase [Magnetococcus marinus MC-1]|uniref:16S rRNA (cytosine(967)-C(5))-methyltransferase n=1 Tax=Magnetococcus marinus (strain ATCC BAA-1437 / JCM 17883 / MC-1) TaxID=156889 RepID=A0LDW0_MAGMM|nr:16S rRNA (cytosine(967)-C(5))-methyltransferase RsmB [Magnetococcus marinus]ABK46153.1 16S rRNA m(5)C-967 methyltransferase [Magnetococcus marinus MC-1]
MSKSHVSERTMAAAAVSAMLSEHLPLETALEQQIHQQSGTSPEMRGRAHEIVVGTIRHMALLEATLTRFMQKDLKAKHHYVRAVLLTALYQAQFMRTPIHSAVDEAVKLVKQQPRDHNLSGFVNAVLRRSTEVELSTTWSAVKDPLKRLATRYSHPLWLVKRWEKRLGMEATEARLAAANAQAPLTLRIHTPKVTVADYLAAAKQAEIEVTVCPEAEETLMLPQGAKVATLPGYSNGWFAVQDRAAQAVARLLAPQAGEAILDACAAPGGKSAHLVALGGAGVVITALDSAQQRLERMGENMARLGIRSQVKLRCADATQPIEGLFDRALVDAPCTGTGVIRRHPDIKWRRNPSGLAEVVKQQQQILQSVAAAVKPGGLLVYATCSLEPDENEQQVARFLKEHPQWKRLPLEAGMAGILPEWIDSAGDLRTEPATHGVDGFYAARLIKDANH